MHHGFVACGRQCTSSEKDVVITETAHDHEETGAKIFFFDRPIPKEHGTSPLNSTLNRAMAKEIHHYAMPGDCICMNHDGLATLGAKALEANYQVVLPWPGNNS